MGNEPPNILLAVKGLIVKFWLMHSTHRKKNLYSLYLATLLMKTTPPLRLNGELRCLNAAQFIPKVYSRSNML